MAIYTRRLAGQKVAHTGPQDLYEAPATGTVVIRDILFTNNTGAVIAAVLLTLRPMTKVDSVFLWFAKDVPYASWRLELRQVIAPRETLVVQASEQPYSILVTGYVFPT